MTFFTESMLSEQVGPVQSPEKPVKVEEAPGVGVSVTVLPERKLAVQVAPQVMPAGVELTEPMPGWSSPTR